MTPDDELIKRKQEHLDLCASDAVAFKEITTGFEHYSFLHYALSEVNIDEIDLSFNFFGKLIRLPFYISCMTGGTDETVNINLKLARVAKELNIPLGLGSQRYALDSDRFNSHFDLIRKASGDIPLIGNIGAAQVVEAGIIKKLLNLIKNSHINALTVHLNPAQELFQKGGETNFKGLLTAIAGMKKELEIPIFVKEVGAGIDEKVADELLWTGVDMIDVAGAGGTSWSGVEILRNGGNKQHDFWDWGMPTTYCIRKVNALRGSYNFLLTASGGISSGMDIAKSLALGADLTASARKVLKELHENGESGVVKMVSEWFETVKKVMFLTGSQSIEELKMDKIAKKQDMF